MLLTSLIVEDDMKHVSYDDIDLFLKEILQELMLDETKNTLLLGLCLDFQKNKSRYKQSFFSVVFQGHKVRSLAVCVNSYKIIIYSNLKNAEKSFELIINELLKQKNYIPGVIASSLHAKQFTNAYKKITGRNISKGDSQRLYRLDKVTFPKIEKGKMRFAEQSDLELTSKWMMKFHNETTPDDPIPNLNHFLNRKIKNCEIAIWENGKPVSMIFTNRPTINGISINMVYTPKEFRKHGYASSLVAHFSQSQLDNGWKFCTLFTDLSNVVSNSIYQKVGYYPISDFQEYNFGGKL